MIPFQYNIEGIWYNKDIFEELGIEVPFETWDDLMAAAETIKEAGITPITVGGGSNWPASRWIGLAIYRALGGDAMKAVYPDRTAKLTDPEYVEAIQILRDMGEAGYFPIDIASKELPVAYNEMVTGNAAMMYMGTWFLANVNDPEQNSVGLDRIGFMPVPAIEGGLGSIEDWPTNTGGPHSINANLYGPKVQAWLKCIGENFADNWLEINGGVSGLRGSGVAEGSDVPVATQEVIDIMNNATSSILWFEGNSPGAKFTSDAGSNAVPFILGNISAEEYMALLQTDVDAAE